MHRAAHAISFMRRFHMDHHKQVSNQTINGLNWKNAFLWFDSKESTIDQWLTEVIPTIVISSITGHWWLFVAYYIWAAFIQETVEHNKKINLYPFITSGKWHLIHHDDPTKNYGVFVPLWDIIFGTRKKLDGN
jgi:sterol desaturase/sphingolipid hydroxylase (fatty acid hydroxylase superfamily)